MGSLVKPVILLFCKENAMNTISFHLLLSDACKQSLVRFTSDLRRLQDVWQQAREGQIDPLALKELLEGVRDTADIPLSVRSLRYLGLETQDMEEFVNLHKQQPIRRQVTTVALGSLY